jgi:type II secretion system protein G
MSSRRGFTLIELLVVMAIIGLLSSIALASLNTARAKARDARRAADLAEVRKALELYYHDHEEYPAAPCGYDCSGYSLSYAGTWDTLATELSPYLSEMPKDPLNSGNCPPWGARCYTYAYGNVGKSTFPAQYDLVAQFETPHPQRCALRQYRYLFNTGMWCGPYTGQLYDASL